MLKCYYVDVKTNSKKCIEKGVCVMKILLASTSPRRHELLKIIAKDFEVASPHFDEDAVKAKSPKKLVETLSSGKAKAVFEKAVGDWCVIGADTIVVLGNEVLGKPKDEDDAKNMLSKLSGTKHDILTGVCVLIRRGEVETKISFVEKTTVKMANLSNEEISKYVATGEPMDKAGGYAIQGLGGKFLEKVSGNYHNIVGLPVSTLYRVLKEEGVI